MRRQEVAFRHEPSLERGPLRDLSRASSAIDSGSIRKRVGPTEGSVGPPHRRLNAQERPDQAAMATGAGTANAPSTPRRLKLATVAASSA